MSLLAAFGWAIASVLAPQLAVALARSIQGGADPDVFSETLCQLFGYSTVIFVLLRLYAPNARLRDALALRATSPIVVVLAIVTGVAIVPALAPVDGFVAARFPAPQEQVDAVVQLLTASTVAARVKLALGAGVLIPIGQELFYRGMLFGRLRAGRSILFAVGATALCEVAATLDPRSMVSAIVPAAAFAFLRGRSGSVIPAVAGQVAYGIAAIAPILMGVGPNDDLPISARWSVAGGVAIVLSLLGARWISANSPRAAAALAEDK
jgi:membrane protease YdiL (CAAX protease family)